MSFLWMLVGYAAAAPDGLPVPEPSTVILLASGLAGIAIMAWRRRRKR